MLCLGCGWKILILPIRPTRGEGSPEWCLRTVRCDAMGCGARGFDGDIRFQSRFIQNSINRIALLRSSVTEKSAILDRVSMWQFSMFVSPPRCQTCPPVISRTSAGSAI